MKTISIAGYTLVAKWEVCSRCEGNGTHTNPSVDGHGITSDEWAQEWDEDSREGYLTGRYDVTCEVCNGDRVMLVPDQELLSDEQRKTLLALEDEEAAYRRECEMERLMGC